MIDFKEDFIIWLRSDKRGEHLPKFYLFESKFPRTVNFTKRFKKLLKENKIECDLRTNGTRFEYDSSDNIGWVLLFAEKDELNLAREKLTNFEYDAQKLFNVSGNGWETGLNVMLNFNKYYK